MEQNRIVLAYLAGETPANIAKQFHISARTVYRITELIRTRPDYDSLVEDWNMELPADIIAQKHGYKNIASLYSVMNKLRQRGYYFEKRRISSSTNTSNDLYLQPRGIDTYDEL